MNLLKELNFSKKLSKERNPGPNGFISEFYKTCKEEIMQFPPEREDNVILPNSLFEVSN